MKRRINNIIIKIMKKINRLINFYIFPFFDFSSNEYKLKYANFKYPLKLNQRVKY